MKRVGMMKTFARNSIWARQKTIYLYPAIVPPTTPKPAHAAAIRPALFEVGPTGLGGHSWSRISVSGSSGVTRRNRQHIKHLRVWWHFKY